MFIQNNNRIIISAGSRSETFFMETIDDTLVEGVEQVTIIMSPASIAELIDEMIDISEDTVVFIEDNDGMYIELLTFMHVYTCESMAGHALQDRKEGLVTPTYMSMYICNTVCLQSMLRSQDSEPVHVFSLCNYIVVLSLVYAYVSLTLGARYMNFEL